MLLTHTHFLHTHTSCTHTRTGSAYVRSHARTDTHTWGVHTYVRTHTHVYSAHRSTASRQVPGRGKGKMTHRLTKNCMKNNWTWERTRQIKLWTSNPHWLLWIVHIYIVYTLIWLSNVGSLDVLSTLAIIKGVLFHFCPLPNVCFALLVLLDGCVGLLPCLHRHVYKLEPIVVTLGWLVFT